MAGSPKGEGVWWGARRERIEWCPSFFEKVLHCLWLLVLLMFTIATNGGMGIEEEERQREGEGGHTTRTRSPILLVDGACSLLVGVVL